MPKLNPIVLSKKLHAVSLVDSGLVSIRSAALAVGIAKSTLHDNLAKFRKAEEDFTKWYSSSDERLVRHTLSIAMEGRASARDTAAVLSRIEGRRIDHHVVLDILGKASQIADNENAKRIPMRIVGGNEDNEKLPLSHVHCAAFDEIFQCKKPILSFIEPVSGYCYLSAAEDRTGDTWEKMLRELKLLGLNPATTNTDGGQGVLKGIGAVFPDSLNLRDLFHVLAKLGKALRAFEGYCYGTIVRFDTISNRGGTPTMIEECRQQMNRSIVLFDALETESNRFRSACYCDNECGYVSSCDLEIIIKRIVALIECAERNQIKHRSIKEARTYFQGATPAIVAYKALLEAQVKSMFGEAFSFSVLNSVCPMIEFLDQIQRSYENRERQKYWLKKLVAARSAFRRFDFIDQKEVDNAINKVAGIMMEFRKSNSLVEALNSVIRRFLTTYKSIPNWFCPLFTFYWNHRVMSRGKRKGLKAREILTGKPFERDWIDVILEKWPPKTRDEMVENLTQPELKAAI